MTTIPIERLTSGNEIIVPGFGFAEVYGVRFDGESYAVDYCTDDRAGWDALDTFHVNAGESVEHASDEVPRYLRSKADVTLEEWQAKSDQAYRAPLTIEEATDVFCALLVHRNGARLYDAVARALDVPSVAAE